MMALYGPRQRRRRNRRIGKLVILIAIVLALSFTSSMTKWDKPVPERWDDPTDGELFTARRYYEINGDNGDSPIFLDRYKQYAPFIRGDVATIEECKK